MRDFNHQQTPKKGPLKRVVRSRFKGGHVLNCDLKSAEVFVAAWVSEDEVLAEALKGPDMHRANAARGFGVAFDDVTVRPAVRGQGPHLPLPVRRGSPRTTRRRGSTAT
jgi:DNA polymerase I-like protein with 3'-5' exonuclease and polymerase domains